MRLHYHNSQDYARLKDRRGQALTRKHTKGWEIYSFKFRALRNAQRALCVPSREMVRRAHPTNFLGELRDLSTATIESLGSSRKFSGGTYHSMKCYLQNSARPLFSPPRRGRCKRGIFQLLCLVAALPRWANHHRTRRRLNK